jgi:hypothetical protein
MIGVLTVARGFLPAHSQCITETIANCHADDAVRAPMAGNNLPLGRVGLIHLFFLEKNRSGSRNGCS